MGNFFGGDGYDFSGEDKSPWLADYLGGGYDTSTSLDYGTGSSGGYDWGNLLGNAALAAGQGYMEYKGAKGLSKEQLKNSKELYAFQLAEQEKYRAMRAKEQEDAFKQYEQFSQGRSNPTDMMQNVKSPFSATPPMHTKQVGILYNGY